jgi:diguanylate cyclase (GGDEF)-like protein/PAS domain S-box-containing protein
MTDMKPTKDGDSATAREALNLFQGGGVLAAYPGPALVLDAEGQIVAANNAAGPLLEILRRDEAGVLAQATAAGAGQLGKTITMPLADPARSQFFDVLILPYGAAGLTIFLARDVTTERVLRLALTESRQRYKDLAESSSDFAWETGADSRFAFVSPLGALGHPADALVGRPPTDFMVTGEDEDAAFPFNARVPVSNVEVWFRDVNGEPACLSVSCRPIFGPGGAWNGTRGLCRDVTETHRLTVELARARHRERLLAYVLRSLRNEADPANVLAVAAATAGPALAADGVAVMRRRADGDHETAAGQTPPFADVAGTLAQTETRTTTHRVLALPTGYANEVNGALLLWRAADADDWSEDEKFLAGELATQLGSALHQAAESEALRALSETDPLTGLMNRRSFEAAAARRMAALPRQSCALLYVDLDNFKPVNDRFGHAEGDQALKLAADLLRQSVRSIDLLARLGGDEFALWLDGLDAAAAAQKATEITALSAALRRYSAGPEQPLRFSVGIATAGADGHLDVAALMERADQAMYAVKRAGKAGRGMIEGAR